MSYDLNFWKYVEEPGTDHLEIYNALCEGENPQSLYDVPANEILERITKRFIELNWQQSDSGPLSWESERGTAFQVTLSKKCCRIDCYGLNGDEMNEFIEIAAQFDLPLYDPQLNERFSLDS